MESLLGKEILSEVNYLIRKGQALFQQQNFAEAKGYQKETRVKTWKVGLFLSHFLHSTIQENSSGWWICCKPDEKGFLLFLQMLLIGGKELSPASRISYYLKFTPVFYLEDT